MGLGWGWAAQCGAARPLGLPVLESRALPFGVSRGHPAGRSPGQVGISGRRRARRLRSALNASSRPPLNNTISADRHRSFPGRRPGGHSSRSGATALCTARTCGGTARDRLGGDPRYARCRRLPDLKQKRAPYCTETVGIDFGATRAGFSEERPEPRPRAELPVPAGSPLRGHGSAGGGGAEGRSGSGDPRAAQRGAAGRGPSARSSLRGRGEAAVPHGALRRRSPRCRRRRRRPSALRCAPAAPARPAPPRPGPVARGTLTPRPPHAAGTGIRCGRLLAWPPRRRESKSNSICIIAKENEKKKKNEKKRRAPWPPRQSRSKIKHRTLARCRRHLLLDQLNARIYSQNYTFLISLGLRVPGSAGAAFGGGGGGRGRSLSAPESLSLWLGQKQKQEKKPPKKDSQKSPQRPILLRP